MSDTQPGHQRAIFIASFLTLIAAGVGFAIRGSILGDWESAFGFTKSDLGTITGGGLVGFGITIIICSIFADQLGYKTLLLAAFVLHILSACVTFAAAPVYEACKPDNGPTYWCLWTGMFMFALANGLCEAAINPLVATLYPNQKTHYLNILHAGWPGGLIIGALLGYAFVGKDAAVTTLPWEANIAFFLVPTLLYGLITLREKFPVSEASAAGVGYGDMLLQFASPVLLFLLVLHAMVGYVELGTDSWITNITKNLIAENSLLLFIYTSAIMFVLRFFAGPIVERINPLGLLFVSALLGACGLYMLGTVGTKEGPLSALGLLTSFFVAGTVYGIGKTFLWPTMLGVVGERFPKGGALVMGTVGGVGMLSAGLLGGPGIGYKQDYYASAKLQEIDAEHGTKIYDEFKAKDPNAFLTFPPIAGLDGKKVSDLEDRVSLFEEKVKKKETISDAERVSEREQKEWDEAVKPARIYGGQMALKWTAVVPAAMAVGYLLLILYFRLTGGYQQVHIRQE